MGDFSVKLGDEHYRGTTAPAKAQFEALHVAIRTGLVTVLNEEDPKSEMGVVSYMGGMDFAELEKLEELLVKGQVTRDSDGVPVARNLFHDAPEDYFLLIYNVARENLGGFWRLRRPTRAAAAEQGTSSTPT